MAPRLLNGGKVERINVVFGRKGDVEQATSGRLSEYSYSRSGSITITSVSNISDLSISSFTAYDFPEPDFANVTEL